MCLKFSPLLVACTVCLVFIKDAIREYVCVFLLDADLSFELEPVAHSVRCKRKESEDIGP